MKLIELIQKVKEQNLDKGQLEDYHSQLSSLFAEMMLECAELEKAEAMYLSITHTTEKDSVALRKICWKATEKGQRLIVLKRYGLATKELLNSLKSRIYTFL